VSSPTEPRHNLAADRLRTVLAGRLPPYAEAIRASAVRLPGGDGATPDLLVTTADPDDTPYGLPARLVHTVVEVVSTPDQSRGVPPYPTAGIPCYWRVELRPWWEYLCPVPAIVVRLLAPDGDWRTTLHPAGEHTSLPVMVSRTELVTVELDPAALVGRRTPAVPRRRRPAC
jgi:hypothetical protein